ncbi:serine hydrolase [Clostridium sp. JN-9]|nr:serine hydrolase [Clostridium sp. JN-9]
MYLKKYLEECAKGGAFPGASFGIVTKEDCMFDSVGYSQLMPERESAGINTIYDLASLSKVVSTTTIILMLIEQGRITLQTKVSDILSSFKHKDVTILNLLTHTSGLPSDIQDYKKFCSTREDLINSVYNTELEYETGKKVMYSDIGYILLGLIAEKTIGKLDEFFKNNIAKPLNMENTFYNPVKEVRSKCAATEITKARGCIKGIVHDGKAYMLNGVSGHAGLFSTVGDLGRFCRMILNEGMPDGVTHERILSKNSIMLMSKCYTTGLNERRGLGWQLKDNLSSMGDLASECSIYHTGFSGTSILIDFKNQMAFILLTNRIHPTRENKELIKLRRNINNIAETIVF